MLFKTNTTFKIEDFYVNKEEIFIKSNMKPDLNILNSSETLKVIPMVKTAKVVKVAPRESEFLYVRNRAVSAGNVIDNKDGSATLIPFEEFCKFFEKYAKLCRGANDNGDFFPHEELVKSYKSFIGKSAFVNHDNDNVEKARGIILDAVYNGRGMYVELLKAVDKLAYPELARGIVAGYTTDTSMGTRCGHSICSICGNKAKTEDDFCEHILNYKASTYNGLPVWEYNFDLDFFEDSFVTVGADPYAKILEKVANKQTRSNVQSVVPQSKNKNSFSETIINEKNNRSFNGKVNNLSVELNKLDWS